ncbi:hypothetical protein [Neorhizobium huautlense]|uniref:hypothetical protein n=1 Tax=Neorhizobium huautlense TaxID=67774 RepID=UPI000CF8AEA8|nr:hypothetical protein [Neorhizobium huautlense]
MRDETEDLAETLIYTLGVIVNSSDDVRRRIAAAYHEAQQLAAGIDLDNGDARPRIVAYLKRFNALEYAGNIEADGWMLTALQERIPEQNLQDWRKLRSVAKKAVDLLPPPPKALH